MKSRLAGMHLGEKIIYEKASKFFQRPVVC